MLHQRTTSLRGKEAWKIKFKRWSKPLIRSNHLKTPRIIEELWNLRLSLKCIQFRLQIRTLSSIWALQKPSRSPLCLLILSYFSVECRRSKNTSAWRLTMRISSTRVSFARSADVRISVYHGNLSLGASLTPRWFLLMRVVCVYAESQAKKLYVRYTLFKWSKFTI